MEKGSHNSASSATVTGILDLFKKNTPIGILPDGFRIEGKNCLVTGASSGLGRAAAVELARRGGKVVIACRSCKENGNAVEIIKRKSGCDSVTAEFLDLSDFSTVRDFCSRLKEKGTRFDIAVFNAGVVPGASRQTPDGFETMFQVNYLAKFYLVNTLIREGIIPMKDGNRDTIPRIVFTASEAHRSADSFNFESFGEFRPYGMKGSMKQYGYTKLLLTAFSRELSRRINPGDEVLGSVFALCPGPVNSKIAREAPLIVQPFIKLIFGIFFRSPEKAVEPLIYLACSPDLEGKTGTYLHLMTEKPVSELAADRNNGERLWAVSEKLLQAAAVL